MRLITAATFGLFCLFGHARAAEIADRFPGAEWDHAMPAAAGWSADRLKAAEEWSGKIGSTAIIVVHHGAIVGEWGNTSAKTPLASVRKSLLSALYGIAVERGQINLNQSLAQLGIDDNEPSLSAEEKAATVRDLLQARSGVYHAALYETPGMAARRPPRHSHPPGTFWYYNNWDFNTLGAIYEHVTKHSIFDAFDSEIARPVGMQDYTPRDGAYVTGADSVYPAYPFEMSARDLARFASCICTTANGARRSLCQPPGSRRARSRIRNRISARATATCGGPAFSRAPLRRACMCRRARFSRGGPAVSSLS